MNLKKKKLKKYIDSYNEFLSLISKVIGYDCTWDPKPLEISDSDYFYENDTLILIDEDKSTFHYTISSVGMKGENLFLGEYQDYEIIMAYEKDASWEETTIFIFHKKNKLEHCPDE